MLRVLFNKEDDFDKEYYPVGDEVHFTCDEDSNEDWELNL